ncbi:hypothetical protein ACIQ7S_03585 [Streptomyces griseoluteus]|uniref:hypothetical protein n=1 Tax=Streptomyces griseoluteus TaxID=29306 RepID=UPI00332F753A
MGKIRTVYRGGSRFYIHPQRPDVVHPGVTSVIGMLPKQDFLGPWNGRMAAELAIDSLSFVQQMAERDRDGAVQYLSGAARRYTKARASLGSDAHDLFERMIRGEGGLTERDTFGRFVRRVRADLEPYRAHFAEFLEAVNPEFVRAEDVAWSDTYEYAGSFDVWLRIWLDDSGNITPDRSGTPHLIIGDWKTSKAAYPDVALQLAAYARADFVMNGETGAIEPMPEFDGAAVLHITDETWSFKPVVIDNEVFAEFLRLRGTFDWQRHGSRRVLLKPIARKSGGRLVTGTQRRAQ